jgi:hypothetical protein
MQLLREALYGFVGKETGIGVALRGNGDEILFASKENSPLRWVPISEFTPDPAGILSVEESVEDLEER